MCAVPHNDVLNSSQFSEILNKCIHGLFRQNHILLSMYNSVFVMFAEWEYIGCHS